MSQFEGTHQADNSSYKEVLQFLEQRDQPISREDLTSVLDVESDDQAQEILIELVDGNQIYITSDWKYRLVEQNGD